MVDPDEVKKAITDKTVLISIMHVNNEIGTIQPIAEIGRIANTYSIPFHSDSVQAVGHLEVDVNDQALTFFQCRPTNYTAPRCGSPCDSKGLYHNAFAPWRGQEEDYVRALPMFPVLSDSAKLWNLLY